MKLLCTLMSLQLLAVFLTAHLKQYQTMDGDVLASFLMLMWRSSQRQRIRNDCLYLVFRLPKVVVHK